MQPPIGPICYLCTNTHCWLQKQAFGLINLGAVVARELKRLDSKSRSPIFLKGSSTMVVTLKPKKKGPVANDIQPLLCFARVLATSKLRLKLSKRMKRLWSYWINKIIWFQKNSRQQMCFDRVGASRNINCFEWNTASLWFPLCPVCLN